MAKEKPFPPLLKTFHSDPMQADCYQGTFEQMGRVVPDARRCVQCGVCSYNCPIGIPVRDYAHRGLSVQNAGCITCGLCIQVCPRGTLRWQTKAHATLVDQPVDDAGHTELLDRVMIDLLCGYGV